MKNKWFITMLLLFSIELIAAEPACQATAYCGLNGANYGSVSCTGNKSCQAGPGWVSCDGATSTCKTTPPPETN